MTALDRARGWFIAQPPPTPPGSGARTAWYAEPATPPRAHSEPTTSDRTAVTRERSVAESPLAPPAGENARLEGAGRVLAGDPRGGASRGARPLAGDPLPGSAITPSAAVGGWQPPVAGEWIVAPPAVLAAAVTSAAVLGRPGEVEPVAAALALALRRETRAKAAAVVVVGPLPPEAGEGLSANAAARRLGARLEAHGLEARVRGRLAWVSLDPDDPQFVSAARRVTLVAAPAVLAISAPRTAAIDAALMEQDLLVIVAADPEGPLAQLAAAGIDGVPVATARPLGRGLGRSLARSGVRAPRSARALLATAPEAGS